ncbi:DUF5400 family protein [Methanofollis ethanolicus]|uniref:DUF5400 family protein n=1 Tax=Methanofollis ethanolicus TaxID=488124 RepID=UPI00082AFB47|nr:DUF5400 family protein [Methanofollis ethanolicus]
MPAPVSAAAVLQVLVAVTAFTQLWETLNYTFHTSPGYGAHMALVTMLPVFAVAAVALYGPSSPSSFSAAGTFMRLRDDFFR